MTDTINYANLMERAEDDARELLESADNSEDAREGVWERCDWDWVIYYGKAMELCIETPSELLNQAEDMVSELCLVNSETYLYEHACHVAFCIVYFAIHDQIGTLIDKGVEA